MIGYPIVDVTMDADQSLGLGSLDGRTWTRLSPYSTVTDGYVRSCSYSWGRDRFIVGDFQTGLATVVLDNSTGEFTPDSNVNALGGDKLAPGMIVSIGYYLAADTLASHLENLTGDTSWTDDSSNATRPIVDSETATGLFDGRTWTASVNTPGDIDLFVPASAGGTPPGLPDGQVWGRFRGRIFSIEDRYEPGGKGAVTVLQIVDFMADLSQYDPGPVTPTRSAEGTGARFDYLWGEAINDGNMAGTTDAGIYDVETSSLPSNYLEESRVAARAEGGAIYADHGSEIGRLVFKDANWLIEDPRSATVQAILGTSRLGIANATTEYSLGRIFNDLYYENTATTVNVSDATSIADYSTRALRRTILNNDNTDLDTIADRDLALLKDAKLVITSVEIRPRSIFEELLCVSTTVGDLLDVTIENDGWSYTQQLHVAGITERWDAQTGDWSCTFRLDSRDGDTVIS